MTRTMDPDRYQMKDIKRRLTRIEKQLVRLNSRVRGVIDQCNSHEIAWPGDPLPDKDRVDHSECNEFCIHSTRRCEH